MTQKKAHEVDGWVRRPDPDMRIVLVYGPDRGRVAEVAAAFAGNSGAALDDPFSTVRIDAEAAEREPGRLIDEARTVPMFSDRRLVWIRGAGAQKTIVDDLAVLAADPPKDALVLVEAGDLKKGAPLRSLAEGSRSAIALPCYADDGRGMDELIDRELGEAGLSIDLDARQLLKSRLGGDRLASRGELSKLSLYAHGSSRITAADVLSSTGDVSGEALDLAVDSVLAGNLAGFDTAFTRLVSEGNRIPQLVSAAMRQFHQILLLRSAMDSEGKSAAAAVAGARPPVFFSRRATIEAALKSWTVADCMAALERISATTLQGRRSPALATSMTRQTLLALAVQAARARSRR